MSNFKNHRAELIKEAWLNNSESPTHFSAGFDAAITLELPVKFAEWQKKECTLRNFRPDTPWLFDARYWSSKELYDYWINNVYKSK